MHKYSHCNENSKLNTRISKVCDNYCIILFKSRISKYDRTPNKRLLQ